jgi:hypothetical protein
MSNKHNRSATISQITKCIKKNMHNVKINLNVNPQFEQNTEFTIYREPKKVQIETSLASKSINEDKHTLVYKNNELIDIPRKLNESFDSLLDTNYYIFGVPKENSFFYSLLYVISKDFKLKKSDVRENYVKTLKENMLAKLGQIFRDRQYSKYEYKKSAIVDNFQNTSSISEGLICLAADYFEVNIIVLNYDTEKYWMGKEYDDTHNEKNVIIIYSNGIYLPLIHIYGDLPDNFIYKCIVNRYKIYRKLATQTELSVVEQETQKTAKPETQEADEQVPTPGQPILESVNELDTSTTIETSKNSHTKPNLRGFSAYKLPELQDLAKEYSINVNNVDSEGKKIKPKTKRQLYDELAKF